MHVMSHAPDELTRGRLRRLGEGIGKVVYASEHWVVKRERRPSEMLALVAVWRMIRKAERFLPAGLGQRLLEKPSKQIQLLRVLVHAFVLILPKTFWYSTHLGAVWQLYRTRNEAGEDIAARRLRGTSLIADSVSFPPTWVRVGGWPGWLRVCEATERVEATLYQRLKDLAQAGRFDEVELWLGRFLDLRQSGWRLGIFSVDAHLKNFGVTEDRVVLIDPGGLTESWKEVESHLELEEVVSEPHIQLGLGPVIGGRSDIAARFDARWKSLVNRDAMRRHWPD